MAGTELGHDLNLGGHGHWTDDIQGTSSGSGEVPHCLNSIKYMLLLVLRFRITTIGMQMRLVHRNQHVYMKTQNCKTYTPSPRGAYSPVMLEVRSWFTGS